MAIPAAIIAASTAAVGTATSIASTRAQQKSQADYAEASARSQRKAAIASQQQVRQKQAIEKLRATNRAHLIRSQIRVAAGESGIGLGGTYESLMRQADYDDSMNTRIIDSNADVDMARIAAGLQPIARAPSSMAVSGLQGGMAGLQTGLSIAGSMTRLKALNVKPDGGGG